MKLHPESPPSIRPSRWSRALFPVSELKRFAGRSKSPKLLQALLASSVYLSQIQGSNAQLISQYVETNSGTTPKGVEIWNSTGAMIDFSGTPLVIEQGSSGGTPATEVTVKTGTLAANAVMVIGTSDMGTYLTGQGLTSVAFITKAFIFNGDDALVLRIGGVIKDTFGVPGSDPGSAWSGNGVSTANQNIQLKSGVTTAPAVPWSDPSGRYETVSSTPATLPAGLAGLGIAPGPAGPDTTRPTIASRTPDVGAANVSINPSFSITFDENIVAGAGTVRLFKENGAADISVPISAVAISVKTASFTATAPLENSATYYVLVDVDAFVDVATPTPNAFVGISSETAWTFTTAAVDVTSPVATLSPADDGEGVLVTANLVITYDEPVAAGSGIINLYKTGTGLIQAFNVPADVTVSGTTLTLNPTALLEPNTSYHLEVPAGVVTDTSPNLNPSTVITAPTGWNFTTRPLPSIVINQYYEGSGTGNLDRYIELKNLTNLPVSLSGYRLTVWSNTSPADNEGWKSGTGTTDRNVVFSDLAVVPSIEPNSTLLIANPGAVAPAYAANSANLKGTNVERATFFDGDDSVVLYFGATNDRANVVDALSVVASEANDTSFYRLTNTPVFSFETGSSITEYLGTVWQQATLAEVTAATSENPFYLQAYLQPDPPTLASFSIGNGATTAGTPRVTLNYTSTGGTPTQYMVAESADFSGAAWTAVPGTSPVIELSSGNGLKTLYFKIRNTFGDSLVSNDTITRADFTNTSPVIFTQYYEGTSNNKYVEITNISASPVNLTTWNLVRWGNAEAENWKVTEVVPGSGSSVINLGGTLQAGQTVVLSSNQAAAPIAAGSAFLASAGISHTGNDSYALYEGPAATANLRDAMSFTNTGNEGAENSFVRISAAPGFDFAAGTNITGFPAVWQPATLATVNAATSNQKEFLGTYLESALEDYAAWIDTFFEGEGNSLIVGFNADPDKDGVPNGIEALIGGNPDSPGVFATSELTKTGSVFTFLYPQDKSVPTGVTASYEWSTDLVNWQGDDEPFGGVTVSLSDGGLPWDDTDLVVDVYQVTAMVTAGAPTKLFIRVVANN